VPARKVAPKQRRGGTLRRVVLWVTVAGALACGIAGFVLYREITSDLPPVDQLLKYQPPVATRIFADDPNPFAPTCGPAPDAICWPSDHEGAQVDLNCG